MIRLKRLREERRESQVRLAAELGVRPSTVAGWENGDRQMDHDMLVKIADHYSVTVDFLLGHDVDVQHMDSRELMLLKTFRNMTATRKDIVIQIFALLSQYD